MTDPKVVELFPKKRPASDYDPSIWPDDIIAAAEQLSGHPPFLMVMRAQIEKQVFEASLEGQRIGFRRGVRCWRPYVLGALALGTFIGVFI